MGFIQKQTGKLKEAALKNEKVGIFRAKVWPDLEKFLLAGPAFVLFIIGIWRYKPGERHFEVAFQSLVIFVFYMAAMVVLQTFDSLFFGSWPMILGVGRSLLALAYLGLTLRQFLEWRSGDVTIYGFTAKFRSRLDLTAA